MSMIDEDKLTGTQRHYLNIYAFQNLKYMMNIRLKTHEILQLL